MWKTKKNVKYDYLFLSIINYKLFLKLFTFHRLRSAKTKPIALCLMWQWPNYQTHCVGMYEKTETSNDKWQEEGGKTMWKSIITNSFNRLFADRRYHSENETFSKIMEFMIYDYVINMNTKHRARPTLDDPPQIFTWFQIKNK